MQIHSPKIYHPLISIVIPVFNKVEYTKQCIESLFRTINLDSGEFEIIIVDDNSSDGTKSYLKTLPNCFRIITNINNLGCGKSMNKGARIARGKYLVFLNNDTKALPGWLDELLNVIEVEKNVGIVGCKLLFSDGTIQHAGVIINKNLSVFHIYYRQPGGLPEANELCDYQAVTGACTIIKKELFLEVLCYDEDYSNSHLDIDLCLKVRQKGYRVLYCPNSVLYHYESISDGRHDHNSEDEKIFHMKWSNNFRSYLKHKSNCMISFIIPCFNRIKSTKLCIENIMIYSIKPFELIIINNGSNDDTKEYLTQFSRKYDNVKIINNKDNLGLINAYNQGINAARGEYYLFMHNDIVTTEGWLCRMLAVGNFYKNIGIIGPRSNAALGSQLVKDVPHHSELQIQAFAGKMAIKFAKMGFYSDRVGGFCMLVKKELIVKIGGFNPRYKFLGFENDFCLRAIKAGYKIAVCSDVFVYHIDGGM